MHVLIWKCFSYSRYNHTNSQWRTPCNHRDTYLEITTYKCSVYIMRIRLLTQEPRFVYMSSNLLSYNVSMRKMCNSLLLKFYSFDMMYSLTYNGIYIFLLCDVVGILNVIIISRTCVEYTLKCFWRRWFKIFHNEQIVSSFLSHSPWLYTYR